MIAGEDCKLCVATLEEACASMGQKYCDLKERYFTDPAMGTDAVVKALRKTLTPEQARDLGKRVQVRLQKA